MSTPRLRFAPSPSGSLHIGGARTALFNWLWARSQGGQFVIRVEDTDQERSSVESVRAILDGLRWLGLDWDEGPEVGGDFGPYFQSERRPRYWEIATQLVEEGKAYRCYATKEELDAARAEQQARDPKQPFRYPGWWRDKGPADWREGQPYVIRLKAPVGGSTDFDDAVYGLISTPNSEQQDFVIMRSSGFPLYNFSCVVDDHDMRITVVGRGADHIGNTPLQVMLYRALGWEPPAFAHLPLIMGKDGKKMSKRDGSTSVDEYRKQGYSPMGVLNYLSRFGWSHGDQEVFSREELLRLFSWDRCGTSSGQYDSKKFLDVNFEQLKSATLTPDDEYVEAVLPFLRDRGLSDPAESIVRAGLPLIRERARSFVEAADALDYYFREPPVFDEKAKAKFLVSTAAPLLRELAAALEPAEPWGAPALEERFRHWTEARGLTMKDVAQPARVALSGRSASPGLFDVMAVLGKERSLARLNRGAELAEGG